MAMRFSFGEELLQHAVAAPRVWDSQQACSVEIGLSQLRKASLKSNRTARR